MVDYKKIAKLIISSLQKELIAQGHKATGNLVNSFEERVIELPDSMVLEILMDDYGTYVNSGRKSGGKKVPINVLIEWIERRGIASGDKEVKNAAFAIQQKIYQEGSPTSGSFRFSSNGRRTGFIDFVIENELGDAFAELEKEVFEDYDAAIASVVNDFNKENK
jgi:hypothetical protein